MKIAIHLLLVAALFCGYKCFTNPQSDMIKVKGSVLGKLEDYGRYGVTYRLILKEVNTGKNFDVTTSPASWYTAKDGDMFSVRMRRFAIFPDAQDGRVQELFTWAGIVLAMIWVVLSFYFERRINYDNRYRFDW